MPLLLESGSGLLLETTDALLLEGEVLAPPPTGSRFWQPGTSDLWRPWPGAVTVKAQQYEIRWCTPGPEEACLTHVETGYDVDDLIEWVNDFATPAAPVRLPLTQEYRAITNVQLTVVQSTGEPVRVADVLDKSTLGPLIRTRFADGTATAATVDAIIKGY
jgi:hypothetical protein